jgi:hypothetical protein
VGRRAALSPVRRRRGLTLLALLVIAAVALFLLLGPSGSGARAGVAPGAPRADDQPAAAATSAGPARERVRLAALAPSTEDRRKAGLWMLEDPELPVVVADVLVRRRFPDDSHTLDPGQTDLLEPNRRYEGPSGIRQRDRTVEQEDGLTVVFTGDRFRLVGDESLAVSLTVRRGETAVPVRVVSAVAREMHPVTRQPLGVDAPFELADPGTHTLVGSFAPARTPLAGFEGWVHLEVEYDFGGTQNGFSTLEVFVQPAGTEPARFTGRVREQMIDGTLWFYLEIDVRQAGAYVFDANVFDAAGEPVAFMRARQELGQGLGEVPMRLFGRVVHEKGVDGPFTLRDLRGYLFLAGQDPDRRHVPDGATYTSHAYTLDDFSDEEYWDEEKQRHVDFLLEAAKSGSHDLPRVTLEEAKEQGWRPPI